MIKVMCIYYMKMRCAQSIVHLVKLLHVKSLYIFHMNDSSSWQVQCTHWRLVSVALSAVWDVPVCQLSIVEGGNGGLGFLCLLLVLL